MTFSAPISRVKPPSRLAARHAINPELVRIGEIELVSDVIMGLQGMDGHNIRLTPKKDKYIFDQTGRIGSSERTLCSFILDCGLCFLRVREYCDNGTKHQGLISRAFSAAIENEMLGYFKLLADLRAQLSGEDSNENEIKLTLSLVSETIAPWRRRMELLYSIVKSCGHLKGGELVSRLNLDMDVLSGNDPCYTIVRRLLSSICQPFYQFIVRWVCDGHLDDPHGEFFVNCSPTTSDAKLWSSRYSIRTSMLPSFISNTQAQMILLAGKSINFLQFICKERDSVAQLDLDRRRMQDMNPEWMYDLAHEQEFAKLLLNTYTDIGKHLLDVMTINYHLATHFKALRQYMLLGQGDFVRILLELLSDELDQRADDVSIHHITNMLKTALLQSNAQFEPEEVLDRIDVEPLEFSEGETGWDIFMLKYWVKGPLVTVFTQATMNLYARIFTVMWQFKRMDFLLCKIWQYLTTQSGVLVREVPEVHPIFHSLHLITREMLHFIHQVQFYFTFEVLESAWADFTKELKEAKDLDQIISSHENYLQTILEKSLLNQESEELKAQLDTVLIHVYNLNKLYQDLSSRCDNELYRRNQWKEEVKKRDKQGIWGQHEIEVKQQNQLAQEFIKGVVGDFTSPLNVLLEKFRLSLQQLLLSLANNYDDRLRSLCIRLDFSHFYRKRDPRLGSSLTYSRLSKFYSTDTTQQSTLKSFTPRTL